VYTGSINMKYTVRTRIWALMDR